MTLKGWKLSAQFYLSSVIKEKSLEKYKKVKGDGFLREYRPTCQTNHNTLVEVYMFYL